MGHQEKAWQSRCFQAFLPAFFFSETGCLAAAHPLVSPVGESALYKPTPVSACRLGSCAPVGRVQDRPQRQRRPGGGFTQPSPWQASRRVGARRFAHPPGEWGWAALGSPMGALVSSGHRQRRPRRQPRRWHDVVVTERAVFQGGFQGGSGRSPPWNEMIELYPPLPRL